MPKSLTKELSAFSLNGFPARVKLIEVGPRDGFQSEKLWIPTERKIAIINRLVAAGYGEIEATSFMSPRAVPQMRDAAEVLAGVDRSRGTKFIGLVPNLIGAENAIRAGVDAYIVFLSASESHNRKNLNRSCAQSLAVFPDMIAMAEGTGIEVRGGIATAFGCPFEGEVPVERVVDYACRYRDLGLRHLSLGDTTGMATPFHVMRLCRALAERCPELELSLHFHNTRGLGLVNVMAGLQAGVTAFESSVGGLGGCPFAPNATGNIASEDLVYLMDECGIAHGIDLDALIETAHEMETIVRRPLPGQVMKAGPRLRTHALESVGTADGKNEDRLRTSSVQPLDGIRVIDVSRIVSGPFCTMLLGDMGADVIKVEPPGKGDPIRGHGTIREGMSWYFASFNRNKKSVELDLYSEDGKARFADLLRTADVLVENFRPDVMAKMGFDDETLERLNPRLVVCSINGFGRTGPYADRPAFDFIAQAMSGFMSLNGYAEGEPLRAGPPLTDLVAGLYGAFGIMNALMVRDRIGAGQRVESSMLNGIVSFFAYFASEYFLTGRVPERTGNDHPIASPYGLFTASDGELAIAPSTDDILKRFFDELGLDGVLDDPAYATNEGRAQRRRELNAMIDERLRADTQEGWIERLLKARVPCGRVQTLDQVFSDPQIKAQDMVLDVPRPGRAPVRMLGFPLKLSRTPCRVRHHAPDLGEHNEAILGTDGEKTKKDKTPVRRAKAFDSV